MTIEEEVCRALPNDALTIFSSHSALAGLIAGFSVAGFVLYVDRFDVDRAPGGPDRAYDDAEVARVNMQRGAAMLFALSSLVGLLAAYLFSALTGDHCLLASLESPYPGVLLGIAGLLLVAAIGMATAAVPALGSTDRVVRWMLFGVGGLLMIRQALDLAYSAALSRGMAQARLASLTDIEQALASQAAGMDAGLRGERLAGPILAADVGLSTTIVLWVVSIATILTTGLLTLWYSRHRDEYGYESWRTVIGLATVGVSLGLVALASLDTGAGGDLLLDSPTRWGALLAAQGSVTALIVAAPRPRV